MPPRDRSLARLGCAGTGLWGLVWLWATRCRRSPQYHYSRPFIALNALYSYVLVQYCRDQLALPADRARHALPHAPLTCGRVVVTCQLSKLRHFYMYAAHHCALAPVAHATGQSRFLATRSLVITTCPPRAWSTRAPPRDHGQALHPSACHRTRRRH